MACLGPSLHATPTTIAGDALWPATSTACTSLEPIYFMGSHECEFCPEEPLEDLEAYYRRHRIERDGLVVHFGANNLYVPADGCVYVAPSMIAHYVDVHRYEPPVAFWEAVMNCPKMGSETYRQALIANGPSNEDWEREVQAE